MEYPVSEVSFVIPCLNEEKTLPIAIGFAKEAINALGTPCEIVVADNGSTDRSIDIAQQLGARVVPVEDKGYGNALIGGIQAANGQFIVMGDADGTYDFREIIPFIQKLREGFDLVMGSRLKGTIHQNAMPFLHRYLGTPVLTFLIKIFFHLPISDCNCGMRAFSKAAFERMNMVSGGMEFASEMLIKAGLLKLRVAEIPCSLLKDTRERAPHLKTWRDGWRHLKFILSFASKYLFFIPGVILCSMGIIGISPLLVFGKINVASISLDANFILVFSLPLLLGYQLIWLYFFDQRFLSFAGYLPFKDTTFVVEKYLLFSAGLFIIGASIGMYAATKWFTRGYSTISEIRLLMVGIECVFLSILTFINSMMVTMMNVKVVKGGRQ